MSVRAIGRRAFLTGLCALACNGRGAHAQAKPGVFWTATPPGAPPATLFAYDRVAASIAPPIAERGAVLSTPAHRIVADLPNSRLRGPGIDLSKTLGAAKPLPPEVAQRLLDAIAADIPKPPDFGKLPAMMGPAVLLGEGRTPLDTAHGGSLGALISDKAQALGKPIQYLASLDEIVANYHAPNVSDVTPEREAAVVDYMLSLREKVGPIGKYMGDLYAQGRIDELWRLSEDLDAHAADLLSPFAAFTRGAFADRVADRAVETIKTAKHPVFVMLAYPQFVRESGILDKLRAAEVKAEPLD